MILIDTCVWIDHFRAGDPQLAQLLRTGRALLHPFVLGEIALGSIRDRAAVIESLQALDGVTVARAEDVLSLIEIEGLAGSGIGYVDAHILASARLTPGALVWTRDKRLLRLATRMNIAASFAH